MNTKQNDTDTTGTVVGAGIAGAVVGAGIAAVTTKILSDKENREKIKGALVDVKDHLMEEVKTARGNVEDKMADAKEHTDKMKKDAKKAIEDHKTK